MTDAHQYFCKADTLNPEKPVPDTTLVFDKPLPEFDASDKVSAQRLEARYAHDGAVLEQMLFQCLPGGTYDYLLMKMMDRHRSKLRVRHASAAEMHYEPRSTRL